MNIGWKYNFRSSWWWKVLYHDLHCLQSLTCSLKDLFDFQLLIMASNDFTSLNVAKLKAESVENQFLRITGNLYMNSTIIIFSFTLSLYLITFLSISFILFNLHLIFFLVFKISSPFGLWLTSTNVVTEIIIFWEPKFQYVLSNIFISSFSWF